jgi:tetratricopeptide (TPR) repeat protein
MKKYLFLSIVLTLSFQFNLFAQTAQDYYNKGFTESTKANYQAAIDDYNKAIGLNPSYAWAYNVRGAAKYYLKDYKGAIEDCSKAIEINPKLADAYYGRGIAKYYLNDKNGACSDWGKAVEIGSSDANELIKLFCK